MPLTRSTKNGKPGYKWGKSGKVYTYTPGNNASKERAKQKALRQGRAIEVSKAKKRG
jgi:hypothetical protein